MWRLAGGKALSALCLANVVAAQEVPQIICNSLSPSALSIAEEEQVVVPGLPLAIDIPLEGKIRIRDTLTGCANEAWSPTGDFTISFGPYDPKSKRLYIWGFFENGWIEVYPQAGAWLFGNSGVLAPRLYDPSDDIEDVVILRHSPATGLIFYQGFTAPHWLTGRQSYRVYKIDGVEMMRVPEAEALGLVYYGDGGPAEGLAMFSHISEGSIYPLHGEMVLYDGEKFIEP